MTRVELRTSFAVFVGALSVSSIGCMGVLGPEVTPPASMGTHPVGVTSIEVTDDASGRTIPVEIWYPAASADPDETPAVYDVEAMGMVVAELRSRVDAHRDVAAWHDGGPRPVVLLSHGAGSTRFANVGLAEVLASHGYVVAAPDHTGHTTADGVFGISKEARAESGLDRPHDLTHVLDALERLSERDGVLGGLVDGERVAVAGHSFGGRAALGMLGAEFDVERKRHECEADAEDRDCPAVEIYGAEAEHGRYRYRDPRVKAAVLISPAGYEFYRDDGLAKVDVPVLVIGADRDHDTPFAEKQKPLFEALGGPRYMLELRRAGHLTATDVCAIVASTGLLGQAFSGPEAEDGCGPTYTTPERALDRVSDASLAFFDRFLNEQPDAERRLTAAIETDDPRPGRTVASPGSVQRW